jgi:CDGSH-type Zn-finger protein/truncated hemoglobin YjbI
MGNGDQQGGGTPPAAGQGRLAQVIATRGGTAAPEAPFVIEHREALIFMLCEAAELEHGIMCQYLFAAFSLKHAADGGLSDAELAAATRWRRQVSHVATQEMLHLALVHNLLSAIGGAPHLARPNLPQPADHYPAGVQLALLPFGEDALRHFMFLERPEGMDLDDAEGLAAAGRAVPLMNERDIVPRLQDFATVGHLYRSIEAGLAHLADKHGEGWLFVGPPRAQATETHFRWPELVAVTNLATAQRAIDTILEQGEGPRGDWRDAHFGQFVAILDEYEQLREANPAFDPVRPVMAANVRPCEREVEVPLITDLLTARVTDLFNVGYEILLQIFERYFAHTQESDAQLATLADATIGLMVRVIKPLGDLITTLPVGAGHPGRTAGPSFELFYETDYLMPHRDAAWALLTERLDEAAWLCEAIQTGRGTQIAGQLEPVRAALREITQALAAHLPPGSAHAGLAAGRARRPQAELDSLLARARELAQTVPKVPAGDGSATELAEVFDAAYSATMAAGRAGPDTADALLPRLTDSVLRPLAEALSRLPAAGAAAGSAPGSSSGSAPGSAAELVWAAAKAATRLRAHYGEAGSAAPELAEATAALQQLACQQVAAPEAARRLAEFWELQASLPPMIRTARNGPYLVTNVPSVRSHLGAEIQVSPQPAQVSPQPAQVSPQPAQVMPQPAQVTPQPAQVTPQPAQVMPQPAQVTPQLALCRCGQSAAKPYCDGSHARVGFSDAKDPRRVPDQRDTYPGQQLTIFDNRGICQHSGYCTDRLATAFRAGQEPFVAPSGGRLDEIIRAVRDCPSGALSFAVDGTEARGIVDFGNGRAPAIEVTKDGPYRITGGIALVGPDGEDVPRNAGSSAEHYALCRCGQSQNKPFCSGMHWYVGFSDPAPGPGHEPTLFEWAGGLPALTRLTRLLYEKHVPADPLLAPLFAEMRADDPAAEARWLGTVLGGPASHGDDRGGCPPVAGNANLAMTQEQRARWVALMNLAADETGMPADPEFRAAFCSCIEWVSRQAMAQSQRPGAAHPEQTPMPRWDWGAAGPPKQPDAAAQDDEDGQPAVLPGPGEEPGFAAHIRSLFRQRDRQSMSFAFDLWSYEDVRSHAQDILQRVRAGSMPCDGAWADDKVMLFQRWAESDMRP